MATQPAVPMFGPDGQVHLIPPDQVDAASHAGGQRAVKMADPHGTARWVRQSDVPAATQAGGKLLDAADTASGSNAGALRGAVQKIFGKDWSAIPENVKEHLENFVMGPYEAMTAPMTPEEREDLLHFGPNPTQADAALYRMALKPTMDALREAHRQWKAKNYGLGLHDSPYDEHGNYTPNALSSLLDAIPMVGPWARDIATETLQKGVLPGLAGGATDLAAMEYVPKALGAGADLARTMPARVREFQAPAAELDKVPSGQTMSSRERWRAANELGVNLDRPQATGKGLRGGHDIGGGAKWLTEHSLGGGGKFAENNAANMEALDRNAAELRESAGPGMGREEFGATMHKALGEHRAEMVDEPGLRAAAQGILDRIDKRDMDGQQYGSDAQEALQTHQGQMYDKSGDFLTGALQRKGVFVGGENVEALADKILKEESEYYAAHPSALKLPGVQKSLDQLLPLASSEARVGWYKAIGKDAEAAAEAKANTPSTVRHDTPRNVATLRSDLWNLYQSPEIVKTRPQGWLKQLVGVLDNSLTDPENERGMTPADIQKFRAGTSLWKRMKSMYDDPQSPFFSILRSAEPKTVAGTLEKLGPTAAKQFREAMHDVGRDDLVRQQQRQIVRHILDPNEDGVPDFGGLAARYERIPKENLGELLQPEHLTALGDLAKRTKAKTPYDTFPHLKQVVEAPDGLTASRAMFADNGALRLTPAEVREIERARPDLIPLLRRQTIDRLVQPVENGEPDLKNFPTRWGRKVDPAAAVLTPEQMEHLDKLAEVSRVVHGDVNPSGSGKVAQRVLEGSALGSGIGSAITLTAMGRPLEGAAAFAIPVAQLAAERTVASRLVNPKATAAIMEHEKPPTLREIFKKAGQRRGLISGAAEMLRPGPEDGGFDPGGSPPPAPATPPPTAPTDNGSPAAPVPDIEAAPTVEETVPSPTAMPSSAASTPVAAASPKTEAVPAVQSSLRDKFAQAIERRSAPAAAPAAPKAVVAPAPPVEREGISTPPPQSVVENTAVAEPNEVHDPVRAAEELRQLEGKPAAAPEASPKAPAESGGWSDEQWDRWLDQREQQIAEQDKNPSPARRAQKAFSEAQKVAWNDPQNYAKGKVANDHYQKWMEEVDKERNSAVPPAAPVEREGISTPPRQSAVENTAVAEPNEVHNPVKAAAELRQLEGKPPAQAVPPERSNPAAPVAQPGGPTKPAEGVIETGTSTSEQGTPKAKLEPPEGATHEVLGENGETLGHIVDGEYVPLVSAS